jgi:hypothetical protein
MHFLKYNTAQDVIIGPAIDISDGYTALSTLTLSGADKAYIIQSDQTEDSIASNTWTAMTNSTGWYELALTAANTDTIGRMTIAITDVSLCLPVFHHFTVIPAAVYDSIFSGTDFLQVDMTQVRGVTPTVINGTCDGTPSATSITTTLETTESLTTADALIGRTIVFNGDTTSALKAQVATISDYATDGTITVPSGQLTTAPASGDTFVIV